MTPYSYDRRAASTRKMDSATRAKANADLARNGLDGNGRFSKVGQGLSRAFDVLAKYGIEPDETLNANGFMGPEGRRSIHLAFSNPADSFSPVNIPNTMLAITWAEVNPGRFEMVAYLS